MSTDEITAALFYGASQPAQAAPAAPTSPVQPHAGTDATPKPGGAQETAQSDSAEAEAQAVFDGGTPVSAGQADSMLAGPFDPLLTQARMAGDAEGVSLLSEGRQQVAALLVEDGIGAPIVKDLVAQFGDWHMREAMSDDDVDALNERTMAALRKSWGSSTEARIAQAQAYIHKATSRMPWVADALSKGLGSQEGFVRAVYAASRSAARAASKRGRA